MDNPPILIGVTGASGALYAKTLIEKLFPLYPGKILLSISEKGKGVLRRELHSDWDGGEADWLNITPQDRKRLRILPVEDTSAGPASGSYPLKAMVILPCSMRTLAAVSHGMADNLITRAADVTLKEGRPLVLCPRETPLHAIHLENMLTACRAGARIVPPVPAFYHDPQTVEDIVHFVVARVLDQLGFDLPDAPRWKA